MVTDVNGMSHRPAGTVGGGRFEGKTGAASDDDLDMPPGDGMTPSRQSPNWLTTEEYGDGVPLHVFESRDGRCRLETRKALIRRSDLERLERCAEQLPEGWTLFSLGGPSRRNVAPPPEGRIDIHDNILADTIRRVRTQGGGPVPPGWNMPFRSPDEDNMATSPDGRFTIHGASSDALTGEYVTDRAKLIDGMRGHWGGSVYANGDVALKTENAELHTDNLHHLTDAELVRLANAVADMGPDVHIIVRHGEVRFGFERNGERREGVFDLDEGKTTSLRSDEKRYHTTPSGDGAFRPFDDPGNRRVIDHMTNDPRTVARMRAVLDAAAPLRERRKE